MEMLNVPSTADIETVRLLSFEKADTIPFLQNADTIFPSLEVQKLYSLPWSCRNYIPFLGDAETVSASTLESDDCLGFSKGMGRVYINADVAYLLYYTYLVSEKIFTINTNTYN